MFKMGWRHKSVVIGVLFALREGRKHSQCMESAEGENSSQWALYPVKLHFKNESKTFQISKQFISEDLDFPTF